MRASKKIFTALLFSLPFTLSNSVLAADKLSKVFNYEMIGANLPYLEKITGPAKNTLGDKKNKTNIYKVDGCEVTVVAGNGKVQSLGIDKLSQQCTFNLNAFLPNVGSGKFPALHSMTFGQFDAFTGDGKYGADCLALCGNAYDPSVYLNWQGSRADGGLELQLGVVLVNGPAIDASLKWENAMTNKEGQEWVVDAKFNCSNKYNKIAQQAFKNVKITSAKIGYGLISSDCNP